MYCYSSGVRQGIVVLTYNEAMVREATDNMETGISVGGYIIAAIQASVL